MFEGVGAGLTSRVERLRRATASSDCTMGGGGRRGGDTGGERRREVREATGGRRRGRRREARSCSVCGAGHNSGQRTESRRAKHVLAPFDFSSQLLSDRTLRRAPPAAAAARRSATASVARPPGEAARIAPPTVAAGRPRKRSANTMLRTTAMGGGSSLDAADRASAGAAVVDTRLMLKIPRRNGPMEFKAAFI